MHLPHIKTNYHSLIRSCSSYLSAVFDHLSVTLVKIISLLVVVGYMSVASELLSEWGGGHGKRGVRAYNGGLGAEPPAGSRGRAPG